MKRIAVIGGGPKAAALCAKAHCLNASGGQIKLRVFERDAWGAAWTGLYGYTDGEQRLCTPAERDVGFPYGEGLLNAAGVRMLFEEFSWPAFLVQAAGTPEGYRNWVDRGRKPPSHTIYAAYLSWVIEKAEVKKTQGEVTLIGRKDAKWTITYRQKGRERTSGNFDGVVVTGPGPAIEGFPRPEDPKIIDGIAFWRNPEAFLNQTELSEEPIVIAGSGGTSAAIAAWIARRGRSGPILIIGNQAALFTKTESFFENALFSDEEAWSALDPGVRVGVTQRLTRGVVWSSVSDILSASSDVRFRPGRVESADYQPGVDGAPGELRVQVRDATGTHPSPARLVIDAAGFDAWWFADLLPAEMKATTLPAKVNPTEDDVRKHRQAFASGIVEDLSLAVGAGGLHAPMLALAQGPGFASLMVLGSMSERILKPYAASIRVG